MKRVQLDPQIAVQMNAERAAKIGAPAPTFNSASRSELYKITKKFVDAQPFRPGTSHDKQKSFYDTELKGFGLRVGTNAKSYFVEGAVKGKRAPSGAILRRRVDIGRHNVFTPDQARTVAMQTLMQMAMGVDPAVERKRKQQEQKSLRAVWEEFKAHHVDDRKPGTLLAYQKILDRTLKAWMARPARDLTGSVVSKLHTKLGDDCGHAYANSAMRVLSSVLEFGRRRDDVDSNPVSGRVTWFPIRPRKTVIAGEKLPGWLRAVDDVRHIKQKVIRNGTLTEVVNPIGPVGADYLEFVLFTGLRRNEAAKLTWDRVDFNKKTLTVQDTKNNEPLVLPLSHHLVTLLARRKQEASGSTWVFPTPGRKGKEHLAEPRYAAALVAERSKIVHSIHDLRRTFISVAARLVPYPVVKSIVNHRASKKGDVTLDYVSLDVEDLRPHMQTITDFFLAKKADGQGMKITMVAGA